MKAELEKIIHNLKEVMDDLDKIEAGSYGYKSAAPRARKALMEASKELREVRTVIQEVKNSHEEK